LIAAMLVAPDFSEHDPEKWIPVFGKDHAPTKAELGSQSFDLLRKRTQRQTAWPNCNTQ